MGAPSNFPANDVAINIGKAVRHIYVHIPFCHQICPYCSFYKHKPGALANRAFVSSLLAELDRRLKTGIEVRPETIYFGGGTPTLLATGLLQRLLDGFAGRLDLSAVREWTVEANPATFDLEKVRMLKTGGVTRISLGVQSWVPDTLELLGRDHSPAEAEAAFHILREAEMPAVNIDLMFSNPGEALESWQHTLEKTIALAPDHISAYNLNYEEDTPFFERLSRGEFSTDSDDDADFFHQAIEHLEAAGFHHYEISNYARPGFESVHNRAYWNGADYLGLGPSAVSTINDRRWTNLADTAGYVASVESGTAFDTDIELLSRDQRRTEAIALQLRTVDGLEKKWLGNESTNPRALADLLDEGLVKWRRDRLVLTRVGRPMVDSIATYLL